MSPIPSLIARPPRRPERLSLDVSPFWIGSGQGAEHRVFLPGMAERHVALIERADGYWAIPGTGSATINGTPMGSGVRVKQGDVLELMPGLSFTFDGGEESALVSAAPAAENIAVPASPRPRRAVQPMRASSRVPLSVRIGLGVAAALVMTSIVVLYRAATHESSAAQLTAEDSALFDSLLVVAYDQIERGTTLLEIGAPTPALQDFAAAINALKTSRLRNHPYIVPRIEALEASVASIYRERRLNVPTEYRKAKESIGLVSRSLRVALTTTEFAQRFANVGRQFRERFGDALVVTGSDHAEHVSLYGRGSALDIRSRTLSPTQTAFLVGACRTVGIRVKDFSQDSVLQRQIQSAMRAGLADRAGTGLHIHIDRFANRRDAYTAP